MTTRSNRPSGSLETLLLEAIANSSPLATLTASQHRALRERVLTAAAGGSPERTETIRGESLPWNELWPGVWARVLKQDVAGDIQVTLFRMEPNAVVPAHDHDREEECLVLEGEIIIGAHRVGCGDLHSARPGSRHPDITTRFGAVLMVRSGIPHWEPT